MDIIIFGYFINLIFLILFFIEKFFFLILFIYLKIFKKEEYLLIIIFIETIKNKQKKIFKNLNIIEKSYYLDVLFPYVFAFKIFKNYMIQLGELIIFKNWNKYSIPFIIIYTKLKTKNLIFINKYL